MVASESSAEQATSLSADSSPSAQGSPPMVPSNEPLLNRQPATTLKRKTTDQNLEIITMDPHYDLTLIVGTPEHRHGQKAFQVNRGSMRNVSNVWTKMLTGDWAEYKQSEIELADDSWKPLLLVLRMAHSQFAELPDVLSVAELWDLAVLTDKYNLAEIVRIMLELKKWLVPHRAEWVKWPTHPRIQEFAEMALVFELDADYEYLVNRLAVELRDDNASMGYSYRSGDKQAKLRSDLPDRIFTRILGIRNTILMEWTTCCEHAVDMAVRGRMDATNPSNPSCSREVCSVTRCGILLRGIHAAGINPHLQSISTMYQSVAFYWKGLKSVGADFKAYSPCDKTNGYGRTAHVSTCSFDKCFGDFGIISKAKAILKQHTHEEVFAHLQNDEYLETLA